MLMPVNRIRILAPDAALALILFCAISPRPASAVQRTVTMTVTAYCDCGQCNGYKRGSWKFLKLDQWNRYVSEGSDRGAKYTGKTASGGRLAEPRAGLISGETIHKPWTVPGKVLLPWRARQRLGTIAADTSYYPFGTRMYVPGWGWGVVGDRGGAIKGPNHIDIFFNRHGETERWGRPTLTVTVDN
jgi:hypothetical protein